MTDNPDISIEDLFHDGELSVRAYHVCLKNDISSVRKLCDYYIKKGDFKSLRNSGEKTNKQLVSICTAYIDAVQSKQQEFESLEPLAAVLPPEQQQIVEEYLSRTKEQLSTRAKNALEQFGQGVSSLYSLFKMIADLEKDYSKLRNVGEITKVEISEWFEKASLYIFDVRNTHTLTSFQLDSYKARLEREFTSLSENLVYFLNENYHKISSGQFPLFRFLDLLIFDECLIDERDLNILKHHSGYFENYSQLSLSEIALQMDLSSERVRQLIQSSIYQRFWSNIRRLVELMKNENFILPDYSMDETSDLIYFNHDFEINELEKVQFTFSFYYKCFSILLRDYSLVMSHHRESKYLLKTELASMVDFDGFFNQIEELLSSKIEESFFISLQGMLVAFVNESIKRGGLMFDRIYRAVESLLILEHGLIADVEGNIFIKRTTRKQLFEHIVEVLEIENNAMHVEEIAEALQKKGIDAGRDVVRSCLIRYDNFIVVGQSTYALKRWENERSLLAGSIKDVVEFFLASCDNPKHILEISKFVIAHRKTNANSIQRNILNDPHKRFKQFGQNFYGLADKIYDVDLNYRKPQPNWFAVLTRDYFKNGISCFPFPKIISEIAQRFDLEPIQAEWILLNKIEEGRLYLLPNEILSLR